jgi:hypothetical protein
MRQLQESQDKLILALGKIPQEEWEKNQSYARQSNKSRDALLSLSIIYMAEELLAALFTCWIKSLRHRAR